MDGRAKRISQMPIGEDGTLDKQDKRVVRAAVAVAIAVAIAILAVGWFIATRDDPGERAGDPAPAGRLSDSDRATTMSPALTAPGKDPASLPASLRAADPATAIASISTSTPG